MQIFYRTGKFARLVGVTPATIRSWEKLGYLTPHHVSPTGYRYYSEEQVREATSCKMRQKAEVSVTNK